VARVEDFLRDSLGIDEENTVLVANEEDVANVSFTSVLASIKEEEVDKEEAVEEGAKVKDVVVPRTELPPSLQKLDAQRAALLKLGIDSGTDQISEKEEQKEADQEEEVTGESFEDVEVTCSHHDQESNAEQQLGNGLLAVPEVSEESSEGVGGIEQAEQKEDAGEKVEELTGALEHLGCGQEAKELDGLEEGVGELEFHKEESQITPENVVCNLVGEDGEGELDRREIEGEDEEEEGKTSIKVVEHSKNTSHDSGLSRSNDVSFAENERKVEPLAERIVEENLGKEVNVLEESIARDSEEVEEDCGVGVAKEESESKVGHILTLKVKALAAASTTTHLSVEAVTEDFAWFDCPGLKVTEVEDGLQVDVEDRQLGIAAMEGLKHKYVITQQVPIVADPSTGLYTLTFTDSKLLRYTATRQHFLQFCKDGEEPVLSRGIGKQEVLVSFASKEAAVKAVEGTLQDENFPALAVISACRP